MYSEDYERARAQERNTEDVYSKPVRAGKRTYFFDVKATKGNNDFYLTITESKRRQEHDGSFTYDKHKIFLYQEDFEKFAEGSKTPSRSSAPASARPNPAETALKTPRASPSPTSTSTNSRPWTGRPRAAGFFDPEL